MNETKLIVESLRANRSNIPDRTKKPDGIRTSVVPIFEGDAKLFRTPVSGNVWQFQMWVKEEKRYVRKSTRTRQLDEALEIGKEYFFDVKAKLKYNQAVFPKTFGEISDEFLTRYKKEIGLGNITLLRWKLIRGYLKHIIGYVGEDTLITSIPQSKWDEYFIYRKKKTPQVTNETLSKESNTVKRVFGYGIEKGYLGQNLLPVFPKLKSKSNRRESFDIDEWRIIYKFLQTNKWMKNPKQKVEDERFFIRYFILVLINTGIRFGEARSLLWKNIKPIGDNEVKINLSSYQTKTDVARKVIGRRGDVFETIRKYSNHTKPDDYVFVNNITGKPITRGMYYKHFEYLKEQTGIHKTREYTSYYCFRHTYATWRLYAGVDVFSLSRNLGTAVQFIEQHYGHTKTELMVEKLTKDFKTDESGQFLFD